MKIKLAFLDNDTNYLQRLTANLSTKFGEKFAFYSFTALDTALLALPKEGINVFVADSSFSVDTAAIPKNCGFAYFVDTPEITSIYGQGTICRFQKSELIYRQILAIYSETLGNVSICNNSSYSTKVIAFSSPCGGMGTSAAASACAIRASLVGKKTLYLNLDSFGGADPYFHGEGTFDMSDVIYALKSKKSNLPIKLESCVRQDPRGVFFYSPARIALDMLELSAQDRTELLSVLTGSGNYNYIIIDADFGIDKDTLSFLRQAQSLIWVCDGMPESSFKTARAYTALKILERDVPNALTDRIFLINNKNQPGSVALELDIPAVGSLPKLRHKMDESIWDQLASVPVFDEILV